MEKLKLCNAKILENKKISNTYYLLKFENKNNINLIPGVFVNIKIKNFDKTFLRRPFAIFSANKKTLTILYKIIGQTTEVMKDLKPLDEINYLGPLGKPLQINLKNKKIYIIVGGSGVGILNSLYTTYFKQNDLQIFLGVNTLEEGKNFKIFFNKKFKNYKISVLENNKHFFQGNVVEHVKKIKQKPDMVFACGPVAMLKNLFFNVIKPYNIPALFSMEKIMACGIGVCMGCTIKIKTEEGIEQKRVCKDGPFFNPFEIIWDEII